jgi:hypothetical protein
VGLRDIIKYLGLLNYTNIFYIYDMSYSSYPLYLKIVVVLVLNFYVHVYMYMNDYARHIYRTYILIIV